MPSRRQQSQPDRCGAVAVPAWGGCVCAAQQSIPADALTALSASGTRIPLFAFRCVCYNIGKNDMRKAGGYTKMAQQGLTILMDRARTGKSAALWREIAAEGLKGRQMLLVPEHASHQAERDLCRACGNRASRHAAVASFRWLAADVLEYAGGAGTLCWMAAEKF